MQEHYSRSRRREKYGDDEKRACEFKSQECARASERTLSEIQARQQLGTELFSAENGLRRKDETDRDEDENIQVCESILDRRHLGRSPSRDPERHFQFVDPNTAYKNDNKYQSAYLYLQRTDRAAHKKKSVIRPDNVCHELGATSVLMETTPW
jgi:hypothetical protein